MTAPPRWLLFAGYLAAALALVTLPLALRDPWFAISIVAPAALFLGYSRWMTDPEGWALVPPVAVLALVCGALVVTGVQGSTS